MNKPLVHVPESIDELRQFFKKHVLIRSYLKLCVNVNLLVLAGNLGSEQRHQTLDEPPIRTLIYCFFLAEISQSRNYKKD